MADDKTSVRAWANILAPALGAAVLGAIGLVIQSRIAADAHAREYVQIALEVLRSEAESPQTDRAALRQWAVEVIQEYAPVKLTEAGQAEMLRQGVGAPSPVQNLRVE